MVGSGRIAAAHSQSLGAIPGVELDTVVGSSTAPASAFAGEQGYAHASADLPSALKRDSFDAVVVCTPNDMHAQQTRLALESGKHVLCEIPIAMSLSEAVATADLADRLDRRAMVCHTERFEAGRLELARRIEGGQLHPLHLVARFHMLRRGALQTAPDREPWRDDVLWHHGCHAVDAALSLLGETSALNLHVLSGPAWPELGVPIDWALHWRTPRGVLVSVSLSLNAHWGVHDYRLVCREDTFVCERGELRNSEGVEIGREGNPGARDVQDREFVDAVRERRAPIASVASILPVMRILQAAWDSQASDEGILTGP